MSFTKVGLAILCLASLASFYAVLSTDPSWRLVVLLSTNPQHYLDYVQNWLLFSILPLSTSIAFVVIGQRGEPAYARRRFSSPASAIIGAILTVWGALQLFLALNQYTTAVSAANSLGINGIENQILIVFFAASIAAALWLFAGLFLMSFPIKAYRIRRIDKSSLAPLDGSRSTK